MSVKETLGEENQSTNNKQINKHKAMKRSQSEQVEQLDTKFELVLLRDYLISEKFPTLPTFPDNFQVFTLSWLLLFGFLLPTEHSISPRVLSSSLYALVINPAMKHIPLS